MLILYYGVIFLESVVLIFLNFRFVLPFYESGIIYEILNCITLHNQNPHLLPSFLASINP